MTVKTRLKTIFTVFIAVMLIGVMPMFISSCTMLTIFEPITPVQGDGELTVHFIDIGQGDSELIVLPDGRTILIDAGDNKYGDTVVNYLKKQGISNLDYVVATHPDADHIGGLDTVINNLNIGKIYMPDRTSTTKTFEDVITAIENKNLKISLAKAGVTVIEEDLLRAVFVAPINEIDDNNNMSAVLHFTYGNTSFLFTGDAEKESERDILSSGANIRANVLKVGHHGSRSSSTAKFIRAVDPEIAVISCGKDNSYGHPHKQTLNTLKDEGVEILRTDLSGTIVLASDGNTVKQKQ